MGRCGFSLTEMLVVVIIIGILAAIALPNMERTRERSYRRTAQDLLLTIYSAERTYFLHNNTYRSLDVTDDWRPIGMDNPNAQPGTQVELTIAAGGPVFTATAKRLGGTCDGKIKTIDDHRQFAGDWDACLP